MNKTTVTIMILYFAGLIVSILKTGWDNKKLLIEIQESLKEIIKLIKNKE